MKIKTNNVPRDIVGGQDVPAEARKQFDNYITEQQFCDGEGSFVKYKGAWYDINDMMRCEGTLEDLGWDACESHTAFSGVLLRLCPGNEQVVMASFYS